MNRIRAVALTVFGGVAVVLATVVVSMYLFQPANVGPGHRDLALGINPVAQAPDAAVPTLSVAVAGEPPIALDPDARPDQPSEDCMFVRSILDRLPPTVEAMAAVRASIVVGTVVEVGLAQWNTEDGRVPEALDELSPDDVLRLLRVAVDDAWVGNLNGTITVWIKGGSIGCWQFLHADFPNELEKGQQFVLFLDGVAPHAGGLTGAGRVLQMWPVGDGGTVATPADGRLATSELRGRLQSDN